MRTWLTAVAIVWALLLPALADQGEYAPLPPAPAGSFTVVVIPDTQGYLGRDTKAQPDSTAPLTNPVIDAHTRWIVDNREAQRIVFVSHVGDIVDRNTGDQWQLARQCMDRLHGCVPYGISLGNHDLTGSGDSSLFQQQFPASRFTEFAWYGGTFAAVPERPAVSGNNANSFQLFSAEGYDAVILHLECNAPDDVLQWADRVLDEHAKRLAMVTTHMDLGPLDLPATPAGYAQDPKGRMRWSKQHGARGNSPQQMWDKCFRKHANLQLLFSGDQSRTTAMYQSCVGDHGNTVHALMSDYTSSGPLRLYRFLPRDKEIQVLTFDTTRRQLVNQTRSVPAADQHQFTLRWEPPAASPPPQPVP
jgi:hypothetical protein